MALEATLTFAALTLVNWFTTSLFVIYTEKRSWIRPLAGLIIACLCYLEFLVDLDFSSSLIYNGVLTGSAFMKFVHVANILYIDGVDLRDLAPKSDTKNIFAALHHFPSALSLPWNIRGIGTRWKTKNVPEWPAFYPNRKSPNRMAFIARQLAVLSWQYITVDFFSFIPSLLSAEEREHMYGKGLEYRYLDLTKEQWIGRISSSMLTWFIIARIMIDGVHRILSIIFVVSGLSRPHDWPPLFGSVRDAYTIRNFWG
jgi:hypothetical protein